LIVERSGNTHGRYGMADRLDTYQIAGRGQCRRTAELSAALRTRPVCSLDNLWHHVRDDRAVVPRRGGGDAASGRHAAGGMER